MHKATTRARVHASPPQASQSVPLRNVEDLLFEPGIDLCHETLRVWWNRFGPMFVSASVHASLHNHFSQERRLVDRQT